MSEPLEITVQGTPNPNAAKFTLNRVVATQGKTYRLPTPPSAQQSGIAQTGNAASAAGAWAEQLLGIAGVTQVFAVNNFISINKTPESSWEVIGPQVEQVLRQAFAT